MLNLFLIIVRKFHLIQSDGAFMNSGQSPWGCHPSPTHSLPKNKNERGETTKEGSKRKGKEKSLLNFAQNTCSSKMFNFPPLTEWTCSKCANKKQQKYKWTSENKENNAYRTSKKKLLQKWCTKYCQHFFFN